MQHHDLISHADGQRAARAAFTNDGGDDGHFELRHLEDVAANGLGLAALFGVDAGISAGRVHKGEHGQLELLGRLHQAQRLAVALGLAHAKVAHGAFFGVAALLVAHHHAGVAVEAGQATYDGEVVRIVAVTVQFHKVSEDVAHVVERVGTLGVAGNLGDLPGAQLAVDVFGELLALLAELIDFFRNIDSAFSLHVAQFFDFGFEFSNRLFEIQKGFFRQRFSP